MNGDLRRQTRSEEVVVETEGAALAEGRRIETDATETVLPLVEEALRVEKRETVTGRVRVRTLTDTVEEHIRQELAGERVEVERVPVDTLVEHGAAPPQVRTEGDVTILPVLEEVIVVEKRLRVVEELRITRHATTEVADVPVTLRKQRAVVERAGPDGTFSPLDPQPKKD